MVRRNVKKAPKSVRPLIRPQLEYASSAWSPWLRHDILELENVQHRAACFVHNNYWPLTSVTQMISILDWETLETRHQKARLSMLYKAINSLTAIPLDHYQPSTATSTRSFHGQNFILPPCRTDVYKRSFSLRQSAAGIACSDIPSHQHHYALLSHLYNCVIN